MNHSYLSSPTAIRYLSVYLPLSRLEPYKINSNLTQFSGITGWCNRIQLSKFYWKDATWCNDVLASLSYVTYCAVVDSWLVLASADLGLFQNMAASHTPVHQPLESYAHRHSTQLKLTRLSSVNPDIYASGKQLKAANQWHWVVVLLVEHSRQENRP